MSCVTIAIILSVSKKFTLTIYTPLFKRTFIYIWLLCFLIQIQHQGHTSSPWAKNQLYSCKIFLPSACQSFLKDSCVSTYRIFPELQICISKYLLVISTCKLKRIKLNLFSFSIPSLSHKPAFQKSLSCSHLLSNLNLKPCRNHFGFHFSPHHAYPVSKSCPSYFQRALHPVLAYPLSETFLSHNNFSSLLATSILFLPNIYRLYRLY